MRKENDDLLNLFQTKLEHAEMPVRDNFWEQLEKDIPVVLHTRRQLVIQRFVAAASVMLILAGASAAFWFLSPKDEIAGAFTQVAISTNTKGNIKNDGIKEEFPSIYANQTNPAPTAVQNRNTLVSLVESGDEEMEESFSVSFSMSFSITEGTTTRNNNSNRLVGGVERNKNNTQEQQNSTTAPADETDKKEKDRTWAVKLYAAASPGKTMNMLPMDEQYTKVKHKLPISFGVTVSKELSNRFALETGLVYTQLNSEFIGDKETGYQQDQTLHYLGIPLKANINLYENKHIDIYAAAGGMVEKCIASNHSSLKPDPLQLSLMASLGLQYNFNDRLSVYAEPGLAYYFDDGSHVNTIRKERPLNFNLLCGVRMTY